MMKSKTLSISINCDPKKVYEFVSDPENLAKWAKGLGPAKKSGGEWIVETPQGPAGFRFAEKNDFGILDHYVKIHGTEIFVPMRVVPNGYGSEVIFTLFQTPGMTDEDFEKDVDMVKKDLETLKAVMEMWP